MGFNAHAPRQTGDSEALEVYSKVDITRAAEEGRLDGIMDMIALAEDFIRTVDRQIGILAEHSVEGAAQREIKAKLENLRNTMEIVRSRGGA